MPSLLIRTPGYWPLPEFVQFHDGKKWMKLKAGKKMGEKEAEYKAREAVLAPISNSSFFVLEASITKALPKKIHLHMGRRRFVLSRWIGGLYSNLRSGSSQRAVRSFYDSIAARYRRHVEPGRDKQLLALAKELDNALQNRAGAPAPGRPPKAKILDVSAGDCTFAKVSRGRFDVFCLDISQKMLALGAKAVPKNRRFVSSASRPPFPLSSFDAVVHTFSNLHPSDRKFFRSFHRVLKPGGLLLYHPVKAPGEQWPKAMAEKTEAALRLAGFSSAEKKSVQAAGKKRSTLAFYMARK